MAGHSVISVVGFDIAGDEDTERASRAPITSCELFTPEGTPVKEGVYDLRMGPIGHEFTCTTCAHRKKLCPGHRGHLDLKVPLKLPPFIAEIRRWLRVVCFKCGEVVVSREKYEHLPLAKRLIEAAATATEGLRCPRKGCGAVHPYVAKDEEDYFTFWAELPGARQKAGTLARGEKRGEKLYAGTIRAIFERVSDSAVEALGRNLGVHPRKLVIYKAPVPPNSIRPGVKSFGGTGSSYHDSTNLLQHLVKRNAQLPTHLPEAMGPLGPGGGQVDGELDRAVQNMEQIYYDLIMGSSSTSVTQGNSGRRGLVVGSRPVHSFLRNLPRKEGRIRANLVCKRVFYISRSTISGNSGYRIDEVGVPLEFSRILQVEETVQEYNRDWLMPFFLNGRRQYPGSTHVWRRATGDLHDVAGLRDVRLEVGDVLFRDVIDGDLAYFNRQPTLERSSIGVHRVIVIRDPSVHTFQMNVVACALYNADRKWQKSQGLQQVVAQRVAVQLFGGNNVSTAWALAQM